MNIVLVSDNKDFEQRLREKLVFLRKDDVVTSFEGDFSGADVVLVHDNVELIKNIREDKNLCIIFVSSSHEHILDAVDAGADDFILADAKDFEFVIRIVNNMKYYCAKRTVMRDAKLLSDEFTGLYRQEYCKPLIKNFKSGTFMALTVCDKISFSSEAIANVLKSALRIGDMAFMGAGANFYVFLPETDFNGAVFVFNKINSEIQIKAGFADISSGDYEKEALNALAEADDGQYTFTEIKENTLDDWLSDTPKGSYKLFRKVFNTKLEKVIAPVFYRLQKSYENKLFETQIEQYTNSEQCVFNLKNQQAESSLRIVYPGFAKIMIYINHEGLDSPENREIALQLDKVTQKELIGIVEDFIEEFRKCYQ